MKLHEEKLKELILAVEKYAVINKIEILNNELCISIPRKNTVLSLDLNKPLQYSITFTLGEKKETHLIEDKNVK